MRYSRTRSTGLSLAMLLVTIFGLPTAADAQPATDSTTNPKVLAFLKPVEIGEKDSDLTKKMKERHNSAVILLDERIKEYKKGIRSADSVFEAARFAGDAKLDLAADDAARIGVLEQTLELAKVAEAYLQEQIDKGFGSKSDLERARYGRLSAEVELLRAKQKANPKPQ